MVEFGPYSEIIENFRSFWAFTPKIFIKSQKKLNTNPPVYRHVMVYQEKMLSLQRNWYYFIYLQKFFILLLMEQSGVILFRL